MLHDYYETIVQTEEVCTIYAHSPAHRLIINIDFIETTYEKYYRWNSEHIVVIVEITS